MIPARLHDSFVWCVLSQSAQAMWQHHFLALPAPAATSTNCHILGTVGGFCIRHDSIMQTRPELQPGHCAHSDCSLPTSCSIASNRAFHGQRTCALCRSRGRSRQLASKTSSRASSDGSERGLPTAQLSSCACSFSSSATSFLSAETCGDG